MTRVRAAGSSTGALWWRVAGAAGDVGLADADTSRGTVDLLDEQRRAPAAALVDRAASTERLEALTFPSQEASAVAAGVARRCDLRLRRVGIRHELQQWLDLDYSKHENLRDVGDVIAATGERPRRSVPTTESSAGGHPHPPLGPKVHLPHHDRHVHDQVDMAAGVLEQRPGPTRPVAHSCREDSGARDSRGAPARTGDFQSPRVIDETFVTPGP